MGIRTVITADPYHKTVMVATHSEPIHELSLPLIVSIEVPNRGVLDIDFDSLYSQLG
jgi:hypothetical protein